MITVAIIEDNLVYRDALETFLLTIDDIQLVYLATDIKHLHQLIATRPQVVILDIDLGKFSGINAIKCIKEALPGTGIFMLTVFDDRDKIVRSLQAGALGYLLKKDPPQKIVDAIRSAKEGEGVINGHMAKMLIDDFARNEPIANISQYNLTKRETEIFKLLIQGHSYKEIAKRSFISMSTLNTHIRNLYDKLGLHSRAEISAKFLQ